MLSNKLNPADQPVVASRSTWSPGPLSQGRWTLFTGPGWSYLEDPKWREGSFPSSERDPCKGEEGGGRKFILSKSVLFMPATSYWKWLPRADTSAFWAPSGGWLNLQGAKFKYLRDKVHIINSLKLLQEIEYFHQDILFYPAQISFGFSYNSEWNSNC